MNRSRMLAFFASVVNALYIFGAEAAGHTACSGGRIAGHCEFEIALLVDVDVNVSVGPVTR